MSTLDDVPAGLAERGRRFAKDLSFQQRTMKGLRRGKYPLLGTFTI